VLFRCLQQYIECKRVKLRGSRKRKGPTSRHLLSRSSRSRSLCSTSTSTSSAPSRSISRSSTTKSFLEEVQGLQCKFTNLIRSMCLLPWLSYLFHRCFCYRSIKAWNQPISHRRVHLVQDSLCFDLFGLQYRLKLHLWLWRTCSSCIPIPAGCSSGTWTSSRIGRGRSTRRCWS
jgi:hypothetical protein